MGRKKKGHEDDPKIDKNIINLMLGDPKVIRLMKLWDNTVRQRNHGEDMSDGNLHEKSTKRSN